MRPVKLSALNIKFHCNNLNNELSILFINKIPIRSRLCECSKFYESVKRMTTPEVLNTGIRCFLKKCEVE